MPLNLLIVESPAKCKKIQEYLGAGWRVQATMGHIRALKEELEGIGFDPKSTVQRWTPLYESIPEKRDAIKNLRSAAATATVYLGSDDDREGEAIAWHTCAILGLDPATTPRVIFHEITESALKAAVASPGRIDLNKFEAQQARSMLDLLIGYTLSPCLWRSVSYQAGLSSGRCQTPALRIIYDRDKAIEAHKTATSWNLQAKTSSLSWTATNPYSSQEAAVTVLLSLSTQTPQVIRITDRCERIATHQPPHPFITSTLQQEASSRLSLNPKATMRAAQTLYEAGHITYMRTDNAVISEEAKEALTALVTAKYGAPFVSSSSDVSKSKTAAPSKAKKATAAPAVEAQAAHEAPSKLGATDRVPTSQNAHECIRPTHPETTPVGLEGAEKRVYDLIWRRTVQSIMAAEQRDIVTLKGQLHETPVTASWDQTRFAGWRIPDLKEADERAEKAAFVANAALRKDTQTPWTAVIVTETHTTPPGRYTEASLISDLERKGIGRPSTYATLVETVIDRKYVEKGSVAATPTPYKEITLTAGEPKAKAVTKTTMMGAERDKLRTTPLGRTVIEWLLTTFEDLCEYGFTAAMEASLDGVADGKATGPALLTTTWDRYKDRYTAIMSTPSTGSLSKCKEFGDGYKVVISKKGPLFVLEKEGAKTQFANLPPSMTLATATKEDAIAAFSSAASGAASGDELGELEGDLVLKKKGPYGHYVTWRTYRVAVKAEETLDEIAPRLLAAPDAIDHTIGPFKIRKGAYGLYMFKTGSKGKPIFVGIPDTTPYSTLTVEGAEALYKEHNVAKAKKFIKK
jgi:DNA topoisomerase-1